MVFLKPHQQRTWPIVRVFDGLGVPVEGSHPLTQVHYNQFHQLASKTKHVFVDVGSGTGTCRSGTWRPDNHLWNNNQITSFIQVESAVKFLGVN